MAAPKKQPAFHDLHPPGSETRTRLREQLSPRTTHGGRESIKRRKTKRPYATNVPIHLVLKSTRAKGAWSLLHRRNKARVQVAIYDYAARFKVKVYSASNVGNHLHLLVKSHDRKNLADFLRVLAGRVAVHVTGAHKGVKKIGRFWDYLTWSRMVNWGRDFFGVRKYVQAGESETKPLDIVADHEWAGNALWDLKPA